MRLSVRISPVEPGVYKLPQRCPHRNCDGKHFRQHQDHCAKAIRDPTYEAVEAKRYYCLRCERTFRVYPKGVSRAQQSNALKAFSVLLYVLGLSYGAVSDVLAALQTLLDKPMFLGKTTVHRKGQPSERLLTVAGVQPSKRDEPVREALHGLLQDLMNLRVRSWEIEQGSHHCQLYLADIHGGNQFIGCLGMIPIRVSAKVSVKINYKLAGHSVAIVLIVQYTGIDKGDLALRQPGPDKHLGNNNGSLDRADDRYWQGPTHFPNDSQTTIAYDSLCSILFYSQLCLIYHHFCQALLFASKRKRGCLHPSYGSQMVGKAIFPYEISPCPALTLSSTGSYKAEFPGYQSSHMHGCLSLTHHGNLHRLLGSRNSRFQQVTHSYRIEAFCFGAQGGLCVSRCDKVGLVVAADGSDSDSGQVKLDHLNTFVSDFGEQLLVNGSPVFEPLGNRYNLANSNLVPHTPHTFHSLWNRCSNLRERSLPQQAAKL